MGHSDKAFAAGWYSAQAAEAAARAQLDSIDPLAALWERQTSRPVTLHVQHKGAWWDVRMECDSYDGNTGPKATDWWLSAVRIDGVWFDAADTFTPLFISELEHAARVMPE